MEWQCAKSEYDVAVIGGGAAGLMAGYAAASRGLATAIIEKMDRPGRKLLITGKGRCNIVNDTDTEDFVAHLRRGGRFMYSSLARFGPRDIMAFFEERGLPLNVERGGRVFPQSNRAADVADRLIESARQAGCDLINARATGIRTAGQAVCGVSLAGQPPIAVRAAIVATGGLSYPKTGSTGDGYRFAEALGHRVESLSASLVPLGCAGDTCARLEGLSLRNVKLSLFLKEKLIFAQQGELVFTSFGISGPLVLSASASLAGFDCAGARIAIDLKPALEPEALDRRLLRDFGENLNREFRNSLDALLPKKLIPMVIERSGIDPQKRVNLVTAAERGQLAGLLKTFELTVTGMRPVEEAVITTGGVRLSELDPKTMMSKIIRNLHFAGEVLDVDGLTGGYNLGVAFASGMAAGSNVQIANNK